MHEKEHIIGLLEKAKKSAEKEDIIELKKLSDQTIHSSAIYSDEDNILVAVTLYSLGKIIEKGERYYKENYKKYFNYYIDIIDKSISFLKKNDEKNFRKHILLMIKSKEISKELKKHMQDLFRKARINKANRIYEHGISMEKTAKLLGISIWELAEYAGQANIPEQEIGKTIDVKKRIRTAMEMFE